MDGRTRKHWEKLWVKPFTVFSPFGVWKCGFVGGGRCLTPTESFFPAGGEGSPERLTNQPAKQKTQACVVNRARIPARQGWQAEFV